MVSDMVSDNMRALFENLMGLTEDGISYVGIFSKYGKLVEETGDRSYTLTGTKIPIGSISKSLICVPATEELAGFGRNYHTGTRYIKVSYEGACWVILPFEEHTAAIMRWRSSELTGDIDDNSVRNFRDAVGRYLQEENRRSR